MTFGRVPASLRLDSRPAAETLAGLRVVQDRVRGVDRVLSVDVPVFGGLPVLLEPSPDVGIASVALFTRTPLMAGGMSLTSTTDGSCG